MQGEQQHNAVINYYVTILTRKKRGTVMFS